MVFVIVILENTFNYFFFSIISVLKSDCIALIVKGIQVIDRYLRGMFFNSCHLLDYFSRGLTARKLFLCGESPIFSDQIGIKIVAL